MLAVALALALSRTMDLTKSSPALYEDRTWNINTLVKF